MEINLKTLGLDKGTYNISLIATGKNCFNSVPITIAYTVKAAEMYVPSITEGSNGELIVTDNELNAGRTDVYRVYEVVGTDTYKLYKTVAYSNSPQSIWCREGVSYVVTAVDANKVESPKSNLIHTSTCFVEGTPVLMADGSYKEIQNIVVGDLVQSYNIEEAVYCDGMVSEVVTGYTDRIAMILTDNGSYIAMAEPHPLYTKDGFHSITNKDGYPTLAVGDILITAFGETTITEISVVDTEPTIVYSLSVIALYGGGAVGLLSQSASGSSTQLTDSISQDTVIQQQLPTVVDSNQTSGGGLLLWSNGSDSTCSQRRNVMDSTLQETVFQQQALTEEAVINELYFVGYGISKALSVPTHSG